MGNNLCVCKKIGDRGVSIVIVTAPKHQKHSNAQKETSEGGGSFVRYLIQKNMCREFSEKMFSCIYYKSWIGCFLPCLRPIESTNFLSRRCSKDGVILQEEPGATSITWDHRTTPLLRRNYYLHRSSVNTIWVYRHYIVRKTITMMMIISIQHVTQIHI